MAKKARARAIGLVAPSGALPDGMVDRAAKFFSARGWQVQAGESCFARQMRFAGPDELRLHDLQRFACDRRIDVVLCARGGYGLSRLLDGIDFEAIARAGRIIVGLSDFTAFNLAYLARAGGISYQGPSAADFAAGEPDPFTVEQFFATLAHSEHGVEFVGDGPDCDVSGTLWGGNLALVTALVGTPYLPRVRGGILFVEDVNEPAYKIERMFLQLLHAGVLQKQQAIVLGDFDPITPMPNDNGFGLSSVVERLRKVSKVPIYTGLPFGHVRRKLTLPVGGRGQLTVRRGGRATLELSRYPALG